jgi:hypothetical protein
VLALTADAWRWPIAGIAAVGVLLLSTSIARSWTSLLPWGLVALAAAYVLHVGGGALDVWSPVVAGVLLGIAETAYWSLELRGRTEDAERLTERRAALVLLLSLGAVAAGGLVLAATSVPLGSGIVTDLLGAAAAVAALALVAKLAR